MVDNLTLARLIKHDFHSFAVKAFSVLNPTTEFEFNWHTEAMAAEVDNLIAGRTRDLLVTMPPRCLKSLMMSIALPAFLLGHDPTTKIVVVSYSDQLAEQLSSDTQRVMEALFYRSVFPDTVLAKRTRRDLKTSAGGRRFATTIGGAMTGIGGDYMIVDDALNASQAYSEATRTQANKFFDETLSTRANNPRTARFVVVMQRLHEDDLAGHILNQGGWKHLKLQGRATEDAVIDLGNGRTHAVKAGDLLDPVRMNQATLDRLQSRLGSSGFQAQIQQDPVPAEGNQIKREWLKRYIGRPDRGDGIVVQSWDTAAKTGVANDYSVCTTWLLKDNVSYLLHVWRARVTYPELKNQVASLYYEYGATHVLIEDASSGQVLIQDLHATSPFNVIGCLSKKDKRARVDGISGALESGRVLFPVETLWLAEFEREMLAFPGGKHDDQVDSATQYILWAIERASSGSFRADFDLSDPIDMGSIAHHLLTIRGLH